jgi:hypothetical protein
MKTGRQPEPRIEPTPEQSARDLLERLGMRRAQHLTAGDVVELANILSRVTQLEAALRAVQWLGGRGYQEDSSGCALCDREERDGHASECLVALALRTP